MALLIDFINNFCKRQKEKDGLRWACFATPAESTSYRFAKKDLQDFPKIRHAGTKANPFYTNSSHCPVDSNIDIMEKIKYEAPFHKITLAGNILHLFLGQKPLPQALYDLTLLCKKVFMRNEMFVWLTHACLMIRRCSSYLMAVGCVILWQYWREANTTQIAAL
jgi:ribonucleoside-triphosphate reductase